MITAADHEERFRRLRVESLVRHWMNREAVEVMPGGWQKASGKRYRCFADHSILLLDIVVPDTIILALPGKSLESLIEARGINPYAIILRAETFDDIRQDAPKVLIVETDIPLFPGSRGWP